MSTPEAIQIDISDFTIDDVIEFQAIVGVEFDEFAAASAGSSSMPSSVMLKSLKAVMYINRRRTDPSYTLADAGAVKVSDLSSIELTDTKPNPTSDDAS